MRAVGLDFERKTLKEITLPEPRLPAEDHVLLKVREVGVCGTDRDLAHFQVGYAPPGESFLVIGHEALAQVVDTGSAVDGVARGDWVIPMVRRPCDPACAPCAHGRRDLCVSGRCTERGIFGLHGYFAEFAVDREVDLVRVPPALIDHAILAEPLSVVEKAVAEGLRLHPMEPRTALVLGAGPIGILAALVFQARGLEVALHSLEPDDDPRARLVRDAGIEYARTLAGRRADIILEATGSGQAAAAGLGALAPLGVFIAVGSVRMPVRVSFFELILNNQRMVGSVNASPASFADALADLARFDRSILARLLRRRPFSEFPDSILGEQAAEPKQVHVISE